MLIENLTLLNKIIDWKRKGYIEVVDYMIPAPREKLYPKKFDGAIAYPIDGRIIETWCESNQKSYTFTQIRKLNTLLTITMPTQDTQKTLQELIQNASFELYPEEGLLEKVQKLPRNSRLAITCTSKKGLDYTMDTAMQLKKEGYDAYPHIIARLIRDEEDIEHIKNKLITNNIHDIFVAAGDIPKPAGQYTCAMDALEGLKKAHFSFHEVRVTGYPEGHPHISQEKLLVALEEKQTFAKKEKIDMKIITQLCFDADTIVGWAHSLHEQGIILPIIVGLSGPCNGLRLLQFALKCGVGASLQFVGAKKALGKDLATHIGLQYTPNTLMNTIVNHPLFAKSNIVGFHLYTFNNVDGITTWLH